MEHNVFGPLPATSTTRPEGADSMPTKLEGGATSDCSGVTEDIRDFDIYTIKQPCGEGKYPPLPALPAQSDLDSDEGAQSYKTLRKRKRRNIEHTEASEKRHREQNMYEEDNVLYPVSPPTLSDATSSPSHPSTVSPSTCPKTREDEEDVASDDTASDDDNDDDDEASTVVPDDFDNESESDIEVLSQSESWVDLSNQPGSPDRVAPPLFGNGEEYLRLLREAQRESNQSSARVSLASSRRDTPRDSPHVSPKSPPNSPNTELATDPEETVMKGVYINYYNKEGDFIRVEKNTETDWIWDWSSRPDQTPPKEWRFSHPHRGVSRGASIRRVMVGNSALFSRDVLYTLLITNVLSLLIGTGIGIWLSKRSGDGGVITLPIN